MRIISGKLGGRTFRSPRTYNTHPMGDKIRGAIFNMLGDIRGLTVLDAFAGSGALAFEAISRGAKSALLVELDKDAFLTIKRNIEALGLEYQARAVMRNIKGWSNNNTDKVFDIVFCDPPYDAVLETLIFQLSRHVCATGVLVLSWPISEPIPDVPSFTVLRHKTYGNATLIIYSRKST